MSGTKEIRITFESYQCFDKLNEIQLITELLWEARKQECGRRRPAPLFSGTP